MQMEPNKMEAEFKAKLNQREIPPSAHAWERLDAMLNEAENKKAVPVRRLNWLYIAAGFVGIILVGTMFFNNDETTKPNTQVAVEDINENPIQNNPIETTADSVNEVNPQPNIVPIKGEAQVAVSQPNQQNVPNKTRKVFVPNTIKQEENQTQIAQVQIQRPTTNNLQGTTTNQVNVIPSASSRAESRDEGRLNAQTNGQLASIDTPLKNPKTIKVDPNSLLSQVDGELELSFREKVIRTASKKYQNVKVALANRNQE